MISVKMKSDISKIKPTINNVLSSLGDDLTENEYFDVKLTLDELLVNGVLHGNKLDSKKIVDLKVDVNSDKIVIVVKDEGEGFIYKENINSHIYSETGRGLMLIDGICDDVSIDSNRVTCIFSRK